MEQIKHMPELRKMNFEDAEEQWKYVTALPSDENGLTNQYDGDTRIIIQTCCVKNQYDFVF